MQFTFAQHLLVLVILTSAFFVFLQYVDRTYKDAVRDIIKEVKEGEFKSLNNSDARKLYERITNTAPVKSRSRLKKDMPESGLPKWLDVLEAYKQDIIGTIKKDRHLKEAIPNSAIVMLLLRHKKESGLPENMVDNFWPTALFYLLYFFYGLIYFCSLFYVAFAESFIKANGYSSMTISSISVFLLCVASLMLIFLVIWQLEKTLNMKEHVDKLRKAQGDLKLLFDLKTE